MSATHTTVRCSLTASCRILPPVIFPSQALCAEWDKCCNDSSYNRLFFISPLLQFAFGFHYLCTLSHTIPRCKIGTSPCGRTGWHRPCMGCRTDTWSHHHEVMAHLGDNSHQGWASSQASSCLRVKSVDCTRCRPANSEVYQMQQL